MARINRQYRRQAARQSRAEFLPQKKGARRALHNEVAALESLEDPLQEGLSSAIGTIKHSNLSATDKAQAIKDFAERQADIPASISSQVLGAREQTAGTLSDLRAEEGAQRGSILQSLLTAATERKQAVQSEVAAEGRQGAHDIQQAELEKALGLGSYATPTKTPTEEAIEKAELEKTQAETTKVQHEAHGNGLTPYEQLNRQESHHEDHATAAYWAKTFLEKGKAGEIPDVPPDPKEWSAETWNHLVGAVAHEGKVPVPAAEKAVGAVRDHFEPSSTGGIVGTLAHAAAGAITHSGAAAAGPQALLQMLGPPRTAGRF